MMAHRRGIDTDDERRLAVCVQKVTRFLRPRPFAVCGGVAVQLSLAKHGLSRQDGRVKDLDILAADLEVFPPERFDGWLLSHFHRPYPGYGKHRVQLVDPETRLRVDIFHDAQGTWRDSGPHQLGEASVLVLAARQVLAHKVGLLERASAERPIDYKHLEDARLLASLLGESEPRVAADRLCVEVYSTDLSARCQRCLASSPLPVPLAPKAEIFSVLGYV
jgi:hypothetical protein